MEQIKSATVIRARDRQGDVRAAPSPRGVSREQLDVTVALPPAARVDL